MLVLLELEEEEEVEELGLKVDSKTREILDERRVKDMTSEGGMEG